LLLSALCRFDADSPSQWSSKWATRDDKCSSNNLNQKIRFYFSGPAPRG